MKFFPKPVPVVVKALLVLLPLTVSAFAGTLTMTLDSNLNSYRPFYYTDITGTQQVVDIAPYIATSLTGYIGDELVICYDYNLGGDPGGSYTGVLAYNTDTATMEATYLLNLLNTYGGYSSPVDVAGPVSLAIWQLMLASSKDTTAFPQQQGGANSAEAYYMNLAMTAVMNGSWTIADSNLYPTLIPDDPAIQRFGIILTTVNPVVVPEPSGLRLATWGFAALAVTMCRRRRPR